jgi:hypothetical protein
MAAAAVFLIMIKWGKMFRERSRTAYWKLVRYNLEAGIAH